VWVLAHAARAFLDLQIFFGEFPPVGSDGMLQFLS
jgi:hypothetical protein